MKLAMLVLEFCKAQTILQSQRHLYLWIYDQSNLFTGDSLQEYLQSWQPSRACIDIGNPSGSEVCFFFSPQEMLT
jgi:hypothetical protein